ncbi:hypothetical protein HQN64_22480 [Enterobacteriaceae bacterium BIT-l23]|uniref:hypothetical protein n=1 Tax=Jejubacter sp. L23 TaxID=3092086 RepID=UPI001585B468|nr:hypothetical protein [Enterobacteriaceae bacterium BIT-l23]
MAENEEKTQDSGDATEAAGTLKSLFKQLESGLGKVALSLAETPLRLAEFTTEAARSLDAVEQKAREANVTLMQWQALNYAAKQSGGDPQALITAFHSLQETLTHSPASVAQLSTLGVSVLDGQGNLRDALTIFQSFSERMASLPPESAEKLARQFGINTEAHQAISQGMGRQLGDYRAVSGVAMAGALPSAQGGEGYLNAMQRLELLQDGIEQRFTVQLTSQLNEPMNRAVELILQKVPMILPVVDKLAEAAGTLATLVVNAMADIVASIEQVIGWWQGLDGEARNLIATLGGAAAAMWLLNMAFQASPLGLILGLATAIMLLYQDFQLWRSGGNSLIDWESWAPGIDYALKSVASLKQSFMSLMNGVVTLGSGINQLFLRFDKFLGIDVSGFSARKVFDWIIEGVRRSVNELDGLIRAINLLMDGDIRGSLRVLSDTFRPSDETKRLRELSADAAADSRALTSGGRDIRLSGAQGLSPAFPFPALNSEHYAQLNMSLGPEPGRAPLPGEIREPSSPAVIAPNLQQETHINIYGATDPRATGLEVADRQQGVNTWLAEQYRTGVA